MIKTTGAEWKAFNADDAYWGKFYMEDEAVTVNGESVDENSFYAATLADADKVEVDGGWVVDQTPGSDKEYSLATFFKKWRKQKTTEFMAVEVPKEKSAAVRAAIVAAGGKVK